jgi:hypothetical protein
LWARRAASNAAGVVTSAASGVPTDPASMWL